MIQDFDNSVSLPKTNGSYVIGYVSRSTRCNILRMVQQYNPDSECYLKEPIEQIVLKGVAALLGSLAREMTKQSKVSERFQRSTNDGLFMELLFKVST